MRTRWLTFLFATSLLAACSQEGEVSQSVSTSDFWSGYEHADWNVIADGDPENTVFTLSHIARFVDRNHDGTQSRVELFCDKYGRVFDRSQNSLELEPSDWKAIHSFLDKRPDRESAARALPVNAFNHNDGHGDILRHSYRIRQGLSWTILFTVMDSHDSVSAG